MNKLILKTTKSGLLAAALMASISASAETIEVKTLKYAGPYAVAQPWMADSVNIKGEAFDLKQLLDSPLSFFFRHGWSFLLFLTHFFTPLFRLLYGHHRSVLISLKKC